MFVRNLVAHDVSHVVLSSLRCELLCLKLGSGVAAIMRCSHWSDLSRDNSDQC